ncbi:molybdopterin-dependent oxidoreductase [Tundrisphaera lichenicola]|uniref:molybdopterin-dependent oxidoreductase n=1 Tax=Tundrisphaera lichenicola TaxID=2029860 RepID=UPI003EBD2BA2
MKTPNSPMPEDELARQLRGKTRRGFVLGGASLLAALTAWKWIGSRSLIGGQPWPLRRMLEWDEAVHRAIFSPSKLAPVFSASKARMPRVNGQIGINPKIDPASWRLQISGPGGLKKYTIEDVKALPRFEMTTELKCIEGWSEVVTWAGARLVDLASASGLATRSGKPLDPEGDPGDLMPYASLMTPDRAYYVGLEAASVVHPQTLLCYEMNGKPLEPSHGAPLRLAAPLKYGIKSLKQIGTIAFMDERPADYWAEKGYDWYSGH